MLTAEISLESSFVLLQYSEMNIFESRSGSDKLVGQDKIIVLPF